MYYVYSGYVGPNNYDNSEGPQYTIEEYVTKEEVIKARRDFEENIHEDCGYVSFRVFRGDEVPIKIKEIITDWELG